MNLNKWNIVQILIVCIELTRGLSSMEPKFDERVLNVTVKESTTAVLPCSVSSLGVHEVVWTDQFSTLLTHEDRRIIDDDRVSIERPYTNDWNLHIREVRYSDQGLYNCQINTTPVKIKVIYLIVLVPAKIIEDPQFHDVVAREGVTVNVVCNVTGTPQPEVTWYRHVTDENTGQGKKRVGQAGEVLVIHNITRNCGGKYECVAFNGVPPAAVKVIEVSVQFPPEIYMPNDRMSQAIGRETILECTVSAFPHGVTKWEKDGVKISTVTLKYRVEMYIEKKNKVTLTLRIFDIQEDDYGTYKCMTSNELGDDTASMLLYQYIPATSSTAIPTSTSTSKYFAHNLPTRYRPSPDPPQMSKVGNHNNQGQGHQSYRGRHDYSGEEVSEPKGRIYTPPYVSEDRVGRTKDGNASVQVSASWIATVSVLLVGGVLVRYLHSTEPSF